jgi:hypothetical protein
MTVMADFHNRGGRSVPSDPQYGGVSLVNGTRTVGDTILNVHGNLTNDEGAEIYLTGNPNAVRLIVGGDMSNAGLLQIEGAGSVEVAGTLNVLATGQIITVPESASQSSRLTAAQINLAPDASFDAQGTIFSSVFANGVFFPAISSPGEVTIDGSLTLTDTARLDMQLGGKTPGPGPSGYDQIKHVTPTPPSPSAMPNGGVGSAGVVLDGTLNVSLIQGVEPTITPQDTFSILVSDRMLTGAFNNVASGGTLKASNGSGAFTVTYNGNSVVLSNYTPTPLALASAVSRKVHGGNATFDLPLSLVAPSTVEPRRGPVATDHQLWFTFTNAIASGNVAVTAGTATIAGTPSIVGNSIGVNLTGVPNEQKITITLSNVTDTLGQVLPNTEVSMRVLLGDSGGDGIVNSGDATQTRSRSGQPLSLTNFRSDVNSDGAINTGDALVVRGRSGSSVP